MRLRNETKDLYFKSDYAAVRIRFQKIAPRREFRKSHQNKTISKWFRPFMAEYLPPGTIGYRRADEQDEVRAQGEGCTVGVNIRGDPCSAGKVAIEIKNKPSSLGPTRSSYPCQRAVTTLKSILRRKPVCRPVRNSLSILYNAGARECGCIA